MFTYYKNFAYDIILHEIQDFESAALLGTFLRFLLLPLPLLVTLGLASSLLRLVATLDEQISDLLRSVSDSIVMDFHHCDLPFPTGGPIATLAKSTFL